MLSSAEQPGVELESGLYLLPVSQKQRSKLCVRATAELRDTVTIKPCVWRHLHTFYLAHVFLLLIYSDCSAQLLVPGSINSPVGESHSVESDFEFRTRGRANKTGTWCSIFHTKTLESIHNFIPVPYNQSGNPSF